MAENQPDASSVVSFEACLDELEKVVRQLEGGDLSLDRSLELFERGMELSDTCRKQLEGQLEKQAAQGQQQLASQLLSLSDELRSMAGASGQGGMAASLASQAASRVRNAGQWLDDRKPGQVADEIQSFARRRPAASLALAVGAGLVAGLAHPRT